MWASSLEFDLIWYHVSRDFHYCIYGNYLCAISQWIEQPMAAQKDWLF